VFIECAENPHFRSVALRRRLQSCKSRSTVHQRRNRRARHLIPQHLYNATYQQRDITLAKHIAVAERTRVDFLAQLLNAFNHPQFVTGQLDQVGIVGDVGAIRNYFIPGASNFGIARAMFPSNARITQLVLKLSF